MVYTIRVIDPNNMIKFEGEFDQQRQVDVEKLKQEYREKYPECKVEVE